MCDGMVSVCVFMFVFDCAICWQDSKKKEKGFDAARTQNRLLVAAVQFQCWQHQTSENSKSAFVFHVRVSLCARVYGELQC